MRAHAVERWADLRLSDCAELVARRARSGEERLALLGIAWLFDVRGECRDDVGLGPARGAERIEVARRLRRDLEGGQPPKSGGVILLPSCCRGAPATPQASDYLIPECRLRVGRVGSWGFSAGRDIVGGGREVEGTLRTSEGGWGCGRRARGESPQRAYVGVGGRRPCHCDGYGGVDSLECLGGWSPRAASRATGDRELGAGLRVSGWWVASATRTLTTRRELVRRRNGRSRAADLWRMGMDCSGLAIWGGWEGVLSYDA